MGFGTAIFHGRIYCEFVIKTNKGCISKYIFWACYCVATILIRLAISLYAAYCLGSCVTCAFGAKAATKKLTLGGHALCG